MDQFPFTVLPTNTPVLRKGICVLLGSRNEALRSITQPTLPSL